jgi:branched-chain amino acid transport system substrate-binding protein
MAFIHRTRVLPALLLVTALVACPRASRGVDANWRTEDERPKFEPQQQPDADEALAQAEQATQGAPAPKAAEELLAVRRAYPQSTAGQEALYRAGVLYFEARRYPEARQALGELLVENPLHPHALDAKLKLGLAALELGQHKDAYQTLSRVAPKLTGRDRELAVEGAAKAAAAGELYGESLRIALREVDQARTEAEQRTAVERVTRLVEAQVPFAELAKVAQDLSSSHPAWPVLTFKLGRIYFHLRDWGRLNDTLERFLTHAPGHPFAPQAEEMLARARRRSEAKPTTVGVLLPMSGRFKPLGDAVLRGIQLALDGSALQVVVKDTGGDVMQAAKAVEELAFEAGAIALLGPLLTDDSRRAAVVAEELQVPILTLTRTEDITAIGPHVFRNMLTNAAQARALAQYGTQVLGHKRFAMLYPNIPYGVELTNAFWDELQRRGAEVRGAESYQHDQTTFAAEVKKLVGRFYLEDRGDYLEQYREISQSGGDAFRKRKAVEKLRGSLEPVVDFEVLFIPDDWRRVGLVAPALAVEDVITNACDPRDLEKIRKTTGKKDLKTVTLFGTNQWSSPKGRSGVPELVERGGKFVTCSVYVDGFYVDSTRPATQAFVARYKKAYPQEREPGLLEAIGFDSAAILRQVIEGGRPKSRAELRDRLQAVRDFEGATGTTSFDARREAQKPLFLMTIEPKGVRELPTPEVVSGS